MEYKEQIEYRLNGQKISEDVFEDKLNQEAEYIAKDNGIFDDYMDGRIAESEYETIIDNIIENIKQDLNEKDMIHIGYDKLEKVKVFKCC